MQISWFEIIAMVINFFVLLFILQKLLYKPVMNAMAQRQERIQKDQIEANEKMNKAKELITEYDSKIADIETEKREILIESRREAQEKKNILLEEYRKEAEIKRKAYLKEIEDEKDNFIDSLRKKLGESAVKIASHILSNISSRELEAEVFKNFLDTLKDLDRNIPDKKVLKEESHLRVQSSRELNESEKEEIESIMKDQMDSLEKISYEIDNSLVLGHRLDLETYTVHTNIKNYLEKIEKDIIENLQAN